MDEAEGRASVAHSTLRERTSAETKERTTRICRLLWATIIADRRRAGNQEPRTMISVLTCKFRAGTTSEDPVNTLVHVKAIRLLGCDRLVADAKPTAMQSESGRLQQKVR